MRQTLQNCAREVRTAPGVIMMGGWKAIFSPEPRLLMSQIQADGVQDVVESNHRCNFTHMRVVFSNIENWMDIKIQKQTKLLYT